MPKPGWRFLPAAARGLLYSLGLAFAIMVIGGVGFLIVEPRVNSLQEGLWLAFTTSATVGYGDIVPSTPLSRLFAVGVVLMGLAVLSLVTASLASVFSQKEERRIEHELLREIQLLSARIERLERTVAAVSQRGPLNGNERTDPAPG